MYKIFQIDKNSSDFSKNLLGFLLIKIDQLIDEQAQTRVKRINLLENKNLTSDTKDQSFIEMKIKSAE